MAYYPQIAAPDHYGMECTRAPGPLRELNLVGCDAVISKFSDMVRLAYQWTGDLSQDEAQNLDMRVRAYVSCAIYDAAMFGGLKCFPAPLPHGRRPAWMVKGISVPISILAGYPFIDEKVLGMEIGAVIIVLRDPKPGLEISWKRLAGGFTRGFSKIRI